MNALDRFSGTDMALDLHEAQAPMRNPLRPESPHWAIRALKNIRAGFWLRVAVEVGQAAAPMFVGAPTADPRSDQQIVASIDGDQQTEDDDGDKQVEEENTGGGGNVDTVWVG